MYGMEIERRNRGPFLSVENAVRDWELSNDKDATNRARLLLAWSIGVSKILDYLYEEIQFHHCDPKAAQLFYIARAVVNQQVTRRLTVPNIMVSSYWET